MDNLLNTVVRIVNEYIDEDTGEAYYVGETYWVTGVSAVGEHYDRNISSVQLGELHAYVPVSHIERAELS